MIILSNAVEDWDTFEKLLDYMYAKDIKSESALHPVVMSEASVSQIAVYILVLVMYVPNGFGCKTEITLYMKLRDSLTKYCFN